MKNHRGRWFPVSIEIFDDPFLSDPYDRRSAWLWMIANAAFTDHPVSTRHGVVLLRRGDVLVGRDFLAIKWGWSQQKVRTFLAQLEKSGMIQLNKTEKNRNSAIVATIASYEDYMGGAPNVSETFACPLCAKFHSMDRHCDGTKKIDHRRVWGNGYHRGVEDGRDEPAVKSEEQA